MKKIIDLLNTLIEQFFFLKTLNDKSPSDVDSRKDFDRNYKRWLLNVERALEFADLKTHMEEFRKARGVEAEAYFLPQITGVLESARDLLEKGFVGKLRHLLHAEMFDTLTAQAKELLNSGHRIPAAVLARIVIERWIRDQADRAGIAEYDSAKASTLNEKLKTNGVFPQPKWRLIQSHLDIGNAAAHGQDSEFTDDDVNRMIEFAEANCV